MAATESPLTQNATTPPATGNSTVPGAPGDVSKQLRMVARLASKKTIYDGDSFDIIVTVQNVSKQSVALGDSSLDLDSFDFDFKYMGDGKKLPVMRLALSKKGRDFFHQRSPNPGAPLVLQAGQQRDYHFAISQMYDFSPVGQAKMETHMHSAANSNHVDPVNEWENADETSAAGKYQIVVHRLLPAQARAHDAATTSAAAKPSPNDLISTPLSIVILPSTAMPALTRPRPPAWWQNTSY
jgi:hypothetical protein